MKDVIDEVIAEDAALRDRREVVATYDELRQQLADVSNERDSCREIADNNAKCAGELTAKLNASEARNSEARELLKASVDQWNCADGPSLSEINGRIRAYLAQSKPATDEQRAGA